MFTIGYSDKELKEDTMSIKNFMSKMEGLVPFEAGTYSSNKAKKRRKNINKLNKRKKKATVKSTGPKIVLRKHPDNQ